MPVLTRRSVRCSSIHPEVSDWCRRVAANGGSVSPIAIAANSRLVYDLQSYGIRSLFARMNTFSGNGLAGCLVPLIRGFSLAGTQFGNASDTNVANAFQASDYVVTGSTGGLQGGGTRYLATGLPTNTLADGNRHLSAYEIARSGATFNRFMGSESAGGAGTQVFTLGYAGLGNAPNFGFGAFGASLGGTTTSTGAHWLGVNQSAGNGIIYKNGVQDASGSTTASTPTSSEVFVFALNRASTPGATDYYTGRLGAYSVGLAMTASQAAAFNAAMQTFQQTLGRPAV